MNKFNNLHPDEFIIPVNGTIDDLERWLIVTRLHKFKGNRRLVAESCGIGRRTLDLKIKQYQFKESQITTLPANNILAGNGFDSSKASGFNRIT